MHALETKADIKEKKICFNGLFFFFKLIPVFITGSLTVNDGIINLFRSYLTERLWHLFVQCIL